MTPRVMQFSAEQTFTLNNTFNHPCLVRVTLGGQNLVVYETSTFIIFPFVGRAAVFIETELATEI